MLTTSRPKRECKLNYSQSAENESTVLFQTPSLVVSNTVTLHLVERRKRDAETQRELNGKMFCMFTEILLDYFLLVCWELLHL